MGFKSWLTGRNDLYADKNKIETVIEQLQTIKSHDIENAKEELGEAIQELNSCTGFQQYVCNTISTNSFDEVIDASGVAIDSLVNNIKGKVDDMKEYSDSGLIKKAFSTSFMASAKFGEGILSVFEDLGDGAVSVFGWVAPKDSGLEKWCKKFVEKEWAHDTFNFYYKSKLAKASLFTEDSALASGFKIAGSVSGYLALGGAISGVGGVVANSSSKVLKAAGTFASSTTRVNTVTAALTGMGSGTEAGLRKGLDFDKAAVKGAKQAAVQGTLAYGAGKFGEYKALKSKNAAIEEAEKRVAEAEANLRGTAPRRANNVFLGDDAMLLPGETSIPKASAQIYRDSVIIPQSTAIVPHGSMVSGETSIVPGAVQAAESGGGVGVEILGEAESKYVQAVMDLENAKAIPIQGYNDSITRAWQERGANAAQSIADKGLIGSSKELFNSGVTKLGGVASGAKDIKVPSLDQISRETGYAVNRAKAAVSNGISNPKGVLSATLDSTKNIASAGANSEVIRDAGVAVATLNATGREIVNRSGRTSSGKSADEQFKNKFESVKVDVEKKEDGKSETNNTSDSLNNNQNNNNSNNPSNNSSNISNNNNNSSNNNNGGFSNYSSSNGSSSSSSGNSSGSSSSSTSTNTGTTNSVEKTITQVEPTSSEEVLKTTDVAAEQTNQTTDVAAEQANQTTDTQNAITNDINGVTANQQPTVVSTPSTSASSGTTYHTGGGYSENEGYVPYTPADEPTDVPVTTEPENTTEGALIGEELEEDISGEIDTIVKGDDVTKIPVSNEPISTKESSAGSSVIPIAAGLSAAAAAGLGAKAYIDHKKNNSSDDEEFDSDEWNGDESTDFEYDNPSKHVEYLDDDDYIASDNIETEKYGARSNDEMEDLI